MKNDFLHRADTKKSSKNDFLHRVGIKKYGVISIFELLGVILEVIFTLLRGISQLKWHDDVHITFI